MFHGGAFDGTPGHEYVLILRADRKYSGGRHKTKYVPAVPFALFALPATSANLTAISAAVSAPRDDICTIREAFVPYEGLDLPDPFATVNGVAIPASVVHGALARHMGDIDSATYDVLLAEFTRQFVEGDGFTVDAEAIRLAIREQYRSTETFLDELQRRGESSASACWEKRKALVDQHLRSGRAGHAPEDLSRRIAAVREKSETKIFYAAVGRGLRRWASGAPFEAASAGQGREYSPWDLDDSEIVEVLPINTSLSTMYQVRYANGVVRRLTGRPPPGLFERLRSERTNE